MASTSDEVTSKTDEVELTPSNNNDLSAQDKQENIDNIQTEEEKSEDQQQKSEIPDKIESEELKSNLKPKQPSPDKEESKSLSSTTNKENSPIKSRSVSFKPNIETRSSTRRPVDFIDTLVQSYKLETSTPSFINEEKKYVPKTNRNRLNPNWREHRTRRLMNKLEELSLWDREEEMKASQAQWLRDQKWEQIQDRQRNHDLCLQLMRARHESEMESAVTLDRAATGANDENTNATIAAAMNLASPANILAYDLPTPPHSLKRRARQQQQEQGEPAKTPIGRYRQFETTMTNKLDKINDKIKPDREIMRAYNPNIYSIPPTVVPLFSETYSALLNVPEPSPSRGHHHQQHYSQPHHYGVASYLHQPSPDYEARLRSYSNRDVRVPLKEQANDYNYYSNNNNNDDDGDYYYDRQTNTIDDDYHLRYRPTSRNNYSPPRRTTSSASATASALYDYSTVANVPREHSFLHTRPPATNSIHNRSLNDDLNAITRFSTETSKKILQTIGGNERSNGKPRSASSTSNNNNNKHVTFSDFDDNNDQNGSSSSRSKYQPVEIISLSSMR